MDEQGDEPSDEQGSEPVEELALEPVAVVRKPRPRALWAVLAAVGVAAGAVVVTSTDDDGNQRAGLPVDLAETARIVNEAAADSSMLARVTYVPGDDLPALGGEATAYRLSGDVDEDQVRQLADALGLDGAVEPGPDGTWSVSAGGDGGGQLDVATGRGGYLELLLPVAACRWPRISSPAPVAEPHRPAGQQEPPPATAISRPRPSAPSRPSSTASPAERARTA